MPQRFLILIVSLCLLVPASAQNLVTPLKNPKLTGSLDLSTISNKSTVRTDLGTIKYFSDGTALTAGQADFAGQWLCTSDGIGISLARGTGAGNTHQPFVFLNDLIYTKDLQVQGQLIAIGHAMHQIYSNGAYIDNVLAITNASEKPAASLGAVTFNSTTDRVTKTGSNLSNGTVIRFLSGTLPTATGGNLVLGQNYLVANATTNDFQLERAYTNEGVIDFTSAGAGTINAETTAYGYSSLIFSPPHGDPNGEVALGIDPSADPAVNDYRDFGIATNATVANTNLIGPGIAFSAHQGPTGNQHRLMRWDRITQAWTCYGWHSSTGAPQLDIGPIGWTVAADGRMGVGTVTLASGQQMTISGSAIAHGQLTSDGGVAGVLFASRDGGAGFQWYSPDSLTANLYSVGGTSIVMSYNGSTNTFSLPGLNLGTSGGTSMSRIRHGSTTLVAGAKVVSDTTVTSNTRIFLTAQSLGTVTAPKAIAVTARTAGTSFTITSADATDTSVVAYEEIEP